NGVDTPPPAREHYVVVDTPEMARRAVDLLHSRGASGIKVREKITPELLRAITDEAHKDGIPVTGHLRSIDARETALAGIDGLEPETGITQQTATHPRKLNPGRNELQQIIFDQRGFAQIDMVKGVELVKLLVSKKVALIPTISNGWGMASPRRDEFAREDAGYASNPLLAYVPEETRKIWASSFVYKVKNPDDLAQLETGYKKLQKLLMEHYKAGGKVLAGSDTIISIPGISLQRELMFLVDAGFTPGEA